MIIRVGTVFPAGTETVLEFEGTSVCIENNGMLYVLKKKALEIVAVVHANRWMWVQIGEK